MGGRCGISGSGAIIPHLVERGKAPRDLWLTLCEQWRTIGLDIQAHGVQVSI
jgi:hypothetical protein